MTTTGTLRRAFRDLQRQDGHPMELHRLRPEFKRTLSEREILLAGQQYPNTETGIHLARLVHAKTGRDMFLFAGGRENIMHDKVQVLIDGAEVHKLDTEEVQLWEGLVGPPAEERAQYIAGQFVATLPARG